MKKIMIIGANWEQEPLLKEAKKMGLYVIATNPENTETFKYSDESYIVEPRDLQKIDEIFQKTQPNAVISDECDYSMFAVAYLTDKYHLPGPKLDALIITNNKYLQRKVCEEIKVKQPKYKLCLTYRDVIEAVKNLGLPIILKPIDNRGSIGISTVKNESDLKPAFLDAIANSHSRQVIVEEFIPGVVVTVEGIFINKFESLTFSTKKMHPNFSTNAMQLRYPGNLPDDISNKIYEINSALVESIGIDFGLTHTEFIVNKNEVNFIEIANRGGGVHASNKITPCVTSFNINSVLVNLALGKKKSILNYIKYKPKKFCLLHFFDFGNGKVKEIKNVEIAKNIKGVIDIKLTFDKGDYLGKIKTAINRPGFVIVASNSVNECETIISEVENKISIKFE